MTLDDLLDEFFDAVAENPSGSPRAEAARQALASAFELAVDPSRSTPESTSVADLLAQLERLKAQQITAREAKCLIDHINALANHDEKIPVDTPEVFAKLRRLSQSEEVKE